AALGEEAVAAMLGSVDRTRVGALLAALAHEDGAALMATVEVLAGFSPDWGGVLDALAEALHRIQVKQLVPGSTLEADGIDVDALAATLRPELVQLWYQMAVSGRRDIHLAPSARVGFEMSLLRMLAFRPGEGGTSASPPAAGAAGASGAAGPAPGSGRSAAAAARAALEGAPAPSRPAAPPPPAPPPSPAAGVGVVDDAPPWPEVPAPTALRTAAPPAAAMPPVPPVPPAAPAPARQATPGPVPAHATGAPEPRPAVRAAGPSDP